MGRGETDIIVIVAATLHLDTAAGRAVVAVAVAAMQVAAEQLHSNCNSDIKHWQHI